jgi:aldose 1-epimerase
MVMVEQSIKRTYFGKLPNGKVVDLFTLTNIHGNSVKITNYGGIVTSINVPDKHGQRSDVVLGFDHLDSYLGDHPFFGAICGRTAGRITNATFELEGIIYKLEANDGANHLHGGSKGFDKSLWNAEIDSVNNAIILQHFSPHLDHAYPGNLNVKVEYIWTDANELIINYKVTTDATTIVNLTNHCYFNLAGSGNILDHILQINADSFAPTDEHMTLLGIRKNLDVQPNDFRQAQAIGQCIEGIFKQHGDTYFCQKGRQREAKQVAFVLEPKSGRTLAVLTTEPVVQFYTGVGLNGSIIGKGDQAYFPFSGFCLETQEYADAINAPELGNYTLHANEIYESTTIYRFGVE